jgi:hypothetical protein
MLQPPFEAMIDLWHDLQDSGARDPRAQPRGAKACLLAPPLQCAIILKMHWVIQGAFGTKRGHVQNHPPHKAVKKGRMCALTCTQSANAAVFVWVTAVGQISSHAAAVERWGVAALTPFVPVRGRAPAQAARRLAYLGADVCVPAGSSGKAAAGDSLEAYTALGGDAGGDAEGGGAQPAGGGPYYVLFAYMGTACYDDGPDGSGIALARDEHLRPTQ